MTADKPLLEIAMKCRSLMRELPLHEKACIWDIVRGLLQSEAKSLELAQLEQQRPLPAAAAPVGDELYRQ